MKKKILICALVAALSTLGFAIGANAADDGAYVGIQGGWSNTHWDTNNEAGLGSDASTTGIAGRAFIGYQFNPYFALELGGLWPHNATNSDIFGQSVTAKEAAGDLQLKGILPLANNFNFYAKAGAAYVHANVTGSDLVFAGFGRNFSQHQDQVYPAFGVGLSYDVSPNVPIDISYMRIQNVAGSSDIPSIDFFAAGIAYHFG